MANLNEMRELKNVVSHIMSDCDLAEEIYEFSSKQLEYKLHNAGLSAIRGINDDRDIRDARAAQYIHDLVQAITFFMEDGNEVSFTLGNSLYPNAERPDWANTDHHYDDQDDEED